MTTLMRGDWSHVDGAAQVWAEATAARDGDGEVAPLADSRPVIARVLDRPGAVLVVAVEDGGIVAFAVAAPTADGEAAADASTAEVEYVGVRPDRWGAGLARGVLRLLCAELAADGYAEAQLLVYTHNRRAIDVYERLGWQPHGTPWPHPRTGKPQQQYRLELTL